LSAVTLLQRLAKSPFTQQHFWNERPHLLLIHGEERVSIRDRGWFPLPPPTAPGLATPPAHREVGPTHAILRFGPGDLERLAAGRPAEGASFELGSADAPARKKQAFAVLALAALGWCGPWPDPLADKEHVRLVRAAHFDLGVGAADGFFALFPPGGPLDVQVRVTHSVRGTELATVGLSDVVGRPELATLLAPRIELGAALPALRAAALWCAENGALRRRLEVGARTLIASPDPRFREGLPLPSHHTWLMRVGWESSND
jgi:hypothetical protein